jgi:DNA-binding MarR family transcriptional regulator
MVRRRICNALVEQPGLTESELGLHRRQWPVWMMFLDLYLIEQKDMEEVFRRFAHLSGLSVTTGFRRTIEMVDAGMLDRIPHPDDHRRSFIRLSAQTRAGIDKVMDDLEKLLF